MDVHQVGKLLFGRPCRLELALWITRHDKPRFFQSEPPKGLRCHHHPPSKKIATNTIARKLEPCLALLASMQAFGTCSELTALVPAYCWLMSW